jgi:hypothetical protein
MVLSQQGKQWSMTVIFLAGHINPPMSASPEVTVSISFLFSIKVDLSLISPEASHVFI